MKAERLKQLMAEEGLTFKFTPIKNEMVIVGPQELARILMALPPMLPPKPITEEQIEEWFHPWEIIAQKHE